MQQLVQCLLVQQRTHPLPLWFHGRLDASWRGLVACRLPRPPLRLTCCAGRPWLPLQVTCYEDSRLLKLFADIVKILYDTDVLGEDTIRFW